MTTSGHLQLPLFPLSELPRTAFSRLALLGIVFALSGASRAAEAMIGQPVQFQARVGEDDYRKFLQECDPERIDPEKVVASPFPAWGALVTRITPGGQAEEAGLEKGWVLKSINGRPYWHHGVQHPEDGDAIRKIEAVSSAGKTKTYQFKPGKIGYTARNFARPENYLIRAIPRGPWDRDMLVAAVAWHGNRIDIAEAALAKSVALGMPGNRFTAYYAALLDLDRNQIAHARAGFEKLKVLSGPDPKIPFFFIPGMRTLSLAFSDFDYLGRVLREQGFLETEANHETADAWKNRPERSTKSLLAHARSNIGENLMPRVNELEVDWVGDDARLRTSFFRNGDFSQTVPPGHHADASFAPEKPVRNAVWNLRFALAKTGPVDERYDSTFKLSLLDMRHTSDAAKKDPTTLLPNAVAQFAVTEEFTGARWVTISAGPGSGKFYVQRRIPYMDEEELAASLRRIENKLPFEMPGRDKIVNVSLIRLENEVEIILNGQPLMHVPIDRAVRELGFHMQIVGYTYCLEKMTLHEIVTE